MNELNCSLVIVLLQWQFFSFSNYPRLHKVQTSGKLVKGTQGLSVLFCLSCKSNMYFEIRKKKPKQKKNPSNPKSKEQTKKSCIQ